MMTAKLEDAQQPSRECADALMQQIVLELVLDRKVSWPKASRSTTHPF